MSSNQEAREAQQRSLNILLYLSSLLNYLLLYNVRLKTEIDQDNSWCNDVLRNFKCYELHRMPIQQDQELLQFPKIYIELRDCLDWMHYIQVLKDESKVFRLLSIREEKKVV